MIPDHWRHPLRVVNLGVVLTAAGLVSIVGGLPGLLFSIAAVGVWIAAPPVFAFVLLQAGLAAVAPSPYSLLVVVTEGVLLVVLLSDPGLPWTPLARVLAGSGALLLGGLVWVGQSIPTWQLTIIVLTMTALLVYGVHRVELLTTGQLKGAGDT